MSKRKPVRRFLLRNVLPRPMIGLYRALGNSWTYVEHNAHHLKEALAEGRIAGAFLHARTFQLLHYFSRLERGEFLLMCSKSRDGELMSRVEEGLGFEVVRGSSGGGGARALVDIIRSMRARPGLSTCLAVDGSHGPRGIAKPGILSVAAKTGCPVLPMSASAKPARVWEHSWDRLAFPKRRAEVHVVFGAPFSVPRGIDDEGLESLRAELEETLLELSAEADGLTGFHDTEPLRLAPVVD